MTKIIRNLALGLAIAGVTAATYATPIPASRNFVFDTANATGGYSAAVSGAKGSLFDDFWTFALTGVSDLQGSFSSIATLGKNPKYDLDIQHFDLLKWDNASHSYSLYQQGTKLSSGAIDFWTLSASGMGEGKYAVSVVGKIAGTAGGSYGGNINLTQLPEPGTWTMITGGLALIALFARRRKNESAALSGTAS